jgi:hypothetical protein
MINDTINTNQKSQLGKLCIFRDEIVYLEIGVIISFSDDRP